MKINQDIIIRMLVLISIMVFILIEYPYYYPFPHLTAVLISWVVFLYTGIIPRVENNLIFMIWNNQHYQFRTSPECSGLLVMAVFMGVIFLTPGIKLRHRFYAFFFLPLLFLANAIRVASGILFGGLTKMEYLTTYHSSVGQILIFVVMTISYAIFLKMYGYHDIEIK